VGRSFENLLIVVVFGNDFGGWTADAPVLNLRCFWRAGSLCWVVLFTTAFKGEVESPLTSPFQVSRGRRNRGSWVYLLGLAIFVTMMMWRRASEPKVFGESRWLRVLTVSG
jgi:hypothetical protein